MATSLLLWLAVLLGEGLAQLSRHTPPPKEAHPKPVEIDGVIYNLYYIPPRCQKPQVHTFPFGGTVDKAMALTRRNNPHQIQGTIQISPKGCLYIEPGSKLYFGKGYGLVVNGTLIARGSEELGGRILFTKDSSQGATKWPTDARLVDGNTTMDGRLELLYRGRWRGVCTNYVNFTKTDVNVTCRQLGFLKGNFTYHSFSRNYSDYLLLEKPGCTGIERGLTECPGAGKIRTGLHICDGQQTVGFECEGLRPGLAVDHWRGIEFYNSSVHTVLSGITRKSESLSKIEYADILYAGLDTFREGLTGIFHPISTISASPYPPVLNNVTIKYSAHNALNMTDVKGDIIIANSTISHNRGHGMLVKTAVGRVLVSSTNISNNWGDGIKMYIVNFTIPNFSLMFSSIELFCNRPTFNPRFPVFLPEQFENDRALQMNCETTFSTVKNEHLTLHFLLMERDKIAHGTLEIREMNRGGALLQSVPVNNGSYPQSITTKTNGIYIKFSYRIYGHYCLHFKPCIRFLLQLSSDEGVESDLKVVNSSVSNNSGHGISVQDMRSSVFINTTEISGNKYGAGLRIYQGAGQLIVNNTLLEQNARSGINVTYAGGYQLFNNTRLLQNKGYGIYSEYLQLNKSRYERVQKIEVVRGKFVENEWIALRFGNYCQAGMILVNESQFLYNFDEAIEYLSCNVSSFETNFSLAFNVFKGNARHAVLASPLLNTIGRMTNNTFLDHSLGAVRMDNSDNLLVNRWYTAFKVNYEIFANKFSKITGRYAASLRLSQNSPVQKLDFKFNILTDNYIQNSFPFLKSRSRANAVVIVSSSNVLVNRNWFENPQSVQEIATHLIDPSVTIDAKLNWWGTADHEYIYNQIFDRDDRYNLAFIDYYPALVINRLYMNYTTKDRPPYAWNFERNGRLGGVLDIGNLEIGSKMKTYHVDKDIIVNPTAKLKIMPGTTLEFENSIGMLVYGTLVADGNKDGWIKFVLRNSNFTVENMSIPVRLVEGYDNQEGRVEVHINGQWGTVCNKGWTEQNSAIVCQQLGLTYNPEYSARKKIQGMSSQLIWLSWVACDELDIDITKCKAERHENGTELDCDHTHDVFVRCQKPSWSGVTIPAIPRGSSQTETQIRGVIIDRAGLLDHAEMSYSPALRIDYNYYSITNVTIKNSLADGIYIKFNHPYSPNSLQHCTLTNNLGNGLVTRYSFLEIAYAVISGNKKTGFSYDPFFTEFESLSIRNFMHSTHVVNLDSDSNPFNIGDNMAFLSTRPGIKTKNKKYMFKLYTSVSNVITLQILGYNPRTDIENVTIFDGGNPVRGTKAYHIDQDLIDFPVVSSGNEITVQVNLQGVMTGRLVFAAISTARNSKPYPLISLRNSTVSANQLGIRMKHYNNPSNDKQDLYFRFKKEEVNFFLVKVENNEEAMHVPSVTKYHENFIPSFEELTRPQRVGSISYFIDYSDFVRNGKGIVAEHNHVDFANNVWHWMVSNSNFRNNKDGGLEIELPRVNDEEERFGHSVTINNTIMKDNKRLAVIINGYFAHMNILHNHFINNDCRRGLFTISGMEKNLTAIWNDFSNNRCQYIMDIDITSHSEYSSPVLGNFSYNSIQKNTYPQSVSAEYENYPTTYALAVKGMENVVTQRNLFNNPTLSYEFVAGVTALSLNNSINANESWWGMANQQFIRKRIFDFDDWNNYAIAKFFPYLTSAHFDSAVTTGTEIIPDPDFNQLGGRIIRSRSLAARSMPYEVVSDVTVMPGVVLKIMPGTQLRFRPNIGILVLGRLEARGLLHTRIKMLPSIKNAGVIKRPKRNSLFESIRLRGGLQEHEGFLELYNGSSRNWNIMCDNQINEKTAEVVCRQLGYETINVRVRFTHLYDHYIYGYETYFWKEFWTYSYHCRGDEGKLDQCLTQINYNLLPCVYGQNYTFIRCGKRNLEEQYNYWGNIRFSPATYEEEIENEKVPSVLEYIDIHGAGILHGKKVGAIQATYRTPVVRYANITGCASDGYDFIAPRRNVEIEHQNITGNLGYGINILVLNGDSTKSTKSSFVPLVESTIPYYLFGLVEMCRMEKEITLDSRMLLYYKYSSTAVDCVKIIRSKYPEKNVALRFLQMNLYNEDFKRNNIEIFDGIPFQKNLIVEIFANISGMAATEQYISRSIPHLLAVHIHATVSQGTFGFVAEVVTIPQSYLSYPNSNNFHIIKNAVLKDNQDGALLYKNVGEINPSFFINMCWIEGNGVGILNLTSSPAVNIDIQQTREMALSRSFISRNKGGTYIVTNTASLATSLLANITNNVFAYTSHGEALNISGHYFQKLMLFENYIFNNTAGDFRNVVQVKGVIMNFTSNFLINNTGHYILASYTAERVTTHQRYTSSGFKDNNSTALYDSTITFGSGKPVFSDNYLVNPENNYELQVNRKTQFSGSKEPIKATENWWGSHNRPYINAKIRDGNDDEDLVVVQYEPFKTSPTSVLDGQCPPGWRLESTRCFRYMGAALNYFEAVRFCRENNAYLAEAKNHKKFLRFLLRMSEHQYDPSLMVWVYTDTDPGMCGVFINEDVFAVPDCEKQLLPFVCENDPFITKPGVEVLTMAIAIAAGIFGFLLLILLIVFILSCVKSKRRKQERLERRASYRSSIRSRSARTDLTNLTKASMADITSPIGMNTILRLSGMTLDETCTDTSEKAKFETFNNNEEYVSPVLAKTPYKFKQFEGRVGEGTDDDGDYFTDEDEPAAESVYSEEPVKAVTSDDQNKNKLQPWLENELSTLQVRPSDGKVTHRSNVSDDHSIDLSGGQSTNSIDQLEGPVPKRNISNYEKVPKQSIPRYSNIPFDKPVEVDGKRNVPSEVLVPSPPPPLMNYQPSQSFQNYMKNFPSHSIHSSREGLDKNNASFTPPFLDSSVAYNPDNVGVDYMRSIPAPESIHDSHSIDEDDCGGFRNKRFGGQDILDNNGRGYRQYYPSTPLYQRTESKDRNNKVEVDCIEYPQAQPHYQRSGSRDNIYNEAAGHIHHEIPRAKGSRDNISCPPSYERHCPSQGEFLETEII